MLEALPVLAPICSALVSSNHSQIDQVSLLFRQPSRRNLCLQYSSGRHEYLSQRNDSWSVENNAVDQRKTFSLFLPFSSSTRSDWYRFEQQCVHLKWYEWHNYRLEYQDDVADPCHSTKRWEWNYFFGTVEQLPGCWLRQWNDPYFWYWPWWVPSVVFARRYDNRQIDISAEICGSIAAHARSINAIDCNADGLLVSVSDDCFIRMWRLSGDAENLQVTHWSLTVSERPFLSFLLQRFLINSIIAWKMFNWWESNFCIYPVLISRCPPMIPTKLFCFARDTSIMKTTTTSTTFHSLSTIDHFSLSNKLEIVTITIQIRAGNPDITR